MNSMKRILAALLVGGAGFGLFVACGTSSDECTLDGDCPDGQACEAQICVDICESDADCLEGQVCEEGVNTTSLVCKDGGATNNGATNNGATNNGTTNNGVATVYYVAQIVDNSAGDDACSISDPGSDIFGVALESTAGDNLGWAEITWEELNADGNDYTDTSILDGSAPGLDADDCPSDFAADSVVALGCGGWIAVEFKDADGNPVPLDATAGQQIRVYEYGGQCGTGTVVDEYDVYICEDTDGIRGGEDGSCTINVLQGGSGEATGDVSGF